MPPGSAERVGEFGLIARIAARARRRGDVAVGIGDDAAVLRMPAGEALVAAVDTLVRGVHYPVDTAPADIGWKSLAVNLSDLAAMGATPRWAMLALTRPAVDAGWSDAFLDGLLGLADAHEVSLVGGDITRGPEAISVTVLGTLPERGAVRRSGARAGDEVWVTGTLGDAAAALAGTEGDAARRLQRRLDRPTPRVQAGIALRGIATAAIDVSDGLLADLGHILDASGVGATLSLADLPTSDALASVLPASARWPLQLGGGDDYELCFTAPRDRAGAVADALAAHGGATRIGRVVDGEGIALRMPDGGDYAPPTRGWRHFPDDGDAAD